MKIKSLQISNVLSFPYHQDVGNSQELNLDSGLNIIIGENGSGKSTALEVINFLFKRVLYRQYTVNQEYFDRRTSITADERKQVLQPANINSFSGFRLEPNWDHEDKPQVIRIKLALDEIDLKNIQNLRTNLTAILESAREFSTRGSFDSVGKTDSYTIDVTLNRNSNDFSIEFVNCAHDFGYEYLSEYNYYKGAISLHNLKNPGSTVEPLYESFTLISSYRNYHAFEPSISLGGASANQQIQQIRSQEYSRSLNTSDKSEPIIFGLVRLQVALKHYNLFSKKLDAAECEAEANNLVFISNINRKLLIVNLECRIRLIDQRTWQYSFEFTDLRRNQIIRDINSLSAGQKAIIHLVFEAYGRGDLKGGLVVIDEPEIHLHYQFQSEYLHVISDLNNEQSCQYVIVTHSEALINSTTINFVRRFALSESGHTEIHSPTLSMDQKPLIRILDNTRSTYAFFAKRVVLVEGDSDRYVYKSVVQHSHAELDQEIAILDIAGKGNFREWNKLFSLFGLKVYRIADFDVLANLHYPHERSQRLTTAAAVSNFKSRNFDWESKIDGEYENGLFILKNGALEHYLGIEKGLEHAIEFCNSGLVAFLADATSAESREMKDIWRRIVQ